MLQTAIIVGAVFGLLLLVDRLLLAAEARGWIYWRRSSPSPGTRASALLELQALLEADRRHTVEVLRQDAHEEDDEGDPPE
jgi:hypothetical protein